MCGINGFVLSTPGSQRENAKIVKLMNDRIIYRGPDDEGLFSDEYSALGMRRLSIIDLNTGNQPIYNEDETKLIVYNGETYNFHDMRKELETKGHKFHSKTDTETVLHAYEEYGADCLKKLNGMFAFAIYDIKKRELFLARDRSGEKPLYFYRDEDKFVFASELKSIIRAFSISKEIDRSALNSYLSLTYIPAPLTIFKGIFKLEAGHYIRYCQGIFKNTGYWDIPVGSDEIINDYGKCKELLRETLFVSVEKMMISDVPLGAFLSGGVDSGIIVGIMSQISKKPIETFTIGFKFKEYDESGWASLTAQRNRANHHLHVIDYNDALESLDKIFETFDEPFADSSAIPTYLVSQYASEFVKVVLTGDSGDELFGGYNKYLINHYSKLYNMIPGRKALEKLVYSLPDRASVIRKIKKVIENEKLDIFERRKALMQLGFRSGPTESPLKPEFYDENACNFIDNFYKESRVADELLRTLYTDFKVVLEGDMLVKVDRMSMLNSIETRVPLLFPDVVELAFRIPSEYKIVGTKQKYIFKETFSDLIHPELMKKSKRGFAVPIGEWFRGPLKPVLTSMFTEEAIKDQGIFDYSKIKDLIESHFSGRANAFSQLWTLFAFQKWYSRYFL